MPLFRALAKNMAPMTNADESPTNRLTLSPIYLSLFIVSTLWLFASHPLICIILDHAYSDIIEVRIWSTKMADNQHFQYINKLSYFKEIYGN